MAKAETKTTPAPKANTFKPLESEILEGLAMYAKIHTPDPGNAKFRIPPAYKIDVMLSDPEQLKKAESLNLKIKHSTNENFTHPYVTFKSRVKEERKPPRVMDSQRNIIPPSVLIGNGSKVRVRFIPFAYGEGEVTAVLLDTQILELVKYEPTAKEGADEKKGSYLGKVDGGFVVEEPGF